MSVLTAYGGLQKSELASSMIKGRILLFLVFFAGFLKKVYKSKKIFCK